MTTPTVHRVSGALVSKNGLTMFLADGTSMVLGQENYYTGRIAEAIMLPIARGEVPVEIDLASFTVEKVLAKVAPELKIEKVDGATVAKVNDQIITKNGEGLEKLMNRAAFGDGAVGFKAFLADLATVTRKHSNDELMNFLKNGDLPIADDGSIIGYKILRYKDSKDRTVFVDPHTRKVVQKLGSRVEMPESLVDDNRRELCSTGLHICSRDYIRGFHGEVLTLVKIKPSDVIAVPTGERSKMRVAGYHICAVLSDGDHSSIRESHKSIYDIPGAKSVLESVIAGLHPPVLEIVKVGAAGQHTVEKVEAPKPVKVTRKREVWSETKKVIDTKDLRKKVDSAQKSVAPKKTDAVKKPITREQIEAAYAKKLKEAKKLWKSGKGMSIREIAKTMGMDRDALSKNLRTA